MSEIMKPTVPVFLFLLNEADEVYLQRRFNTGYMDGCYEPPAGKMDYHPQEVESPAQAACRELFEEAKVTANPDDLELFHAYLNVARNNPWLGLMFRTRRWEGQPQIGESTKCDHAGFFGFDRLPAVTPQVRDGLARVLTAPAIEVSFYTDQDF